MSVVSILKFDIRPVPSIPTAFVSDKGSAYTRDRKNPKVLNLRKPYLGKVGYYVVTYPDGPRRSKPYYIHRMVAEAFVPREAGNNEVRHYDGTRTNNRPDNLIWGTRKENVADTRRHGRMLLGENTTQSRLSNEDVKVIRYLLSRGSSVNSIAVVFDVSWATVKAIKAGRSWGHLADAQNTLAL